MDKKKGNAGIRLFFYFAGLLIMTLGVAISIKAGLGVTPISSVPYTITVVFGMDLGLATAIFSIVAALLEIPILRKKYKIISLFQIPTSLLFGIFMTSCVKAVRFVPDPTSIIVKFILMLISTFVVAMGVFLYLTAEFIPLPTEGFLLSITEMTKIKFATLKVIGDVTMVTISLVTCLIAIHALGSVGIGTIVSAFLVGIEVKFLENIIGKKVKEIMGKG